MVSFGTLSAKWLAAQQSILNQQMTWLEALVANRNHLIRLFKEWDVDGSGTISRKEFRQGVEALRLVAPKTDVNALFNEYDVNENGVLEVSELEVFLSNEVRSRLKRRTSSLQLDKQRRRAPINPWL